jgi:Reverse transcriptase (RNA-dependent DNA polymerase)
MHLMGHDEENNHHIIYHQQPEEDLINLQAQNNFQEHENDINIDEQNDDVSIASTAGDLNDNENEPEPDQFIDQQAIDEEMDEKYGPRASGHDLRPRKPRDYGHLHTMLNEFALTQYSMNQGLKLFKERGVEAVLQELRQLHTRKVITPIMASELTYDQKCQALSYLMFLKEKRSGKIKGRGCADGRKQRSTLSKDDVSSPTVAIESVMLSCIIDSFENRYVATVDVPGAFMQVDTDDLVHMRIDGTMAKLLIRLDPEHYNQYVQEKNGKKVIYVIVTKALYGTLKAALLFWRKLSTVLTTWGFEINPYDTCVANKMINGKQCTILWHVDDLKISHVDDNVVTNIIEKLSTEFGKEAPLTVNRGAVHDYLGMSIDYSEVGKVKISMQQYIEAILNEMPDDMAGVSPSPAANHLFNVDPNCTKLSTDKQEFFHHVVAQLLFLCKRARPDIQTAVSFLCTRVQHPDMDDYKKLCRVIKYLRGTATLPLRLEADSLHHALWWVDASYAVHPDMKSHTGGILSLGKGAVYGTSTRQKINAKSSTEAELIGVAEVLPQAIWTRNFLSAQVLAYSFPCSPSPSLDLLLKFFVSMES